MVNGIKHLLYLSCTTHWLPKDSHFIVIHFQSIPKFLEWKVLGTMIGNILDLFVNLLQSILFLCIILIHLKEFFVT